MNSPQSGGRVTRITLWVAQLNPIVWGSQHHNVATQYHTTMYICVCRWWQGDAGGLQGGKGKCEVVSHEQLDVW